jgi:hypothetical protein
VVQAKHLGSNSAGMFRTRVFEAVTQIRGVKGEVPPPNALRVIVIRLPATHELHGDPSKLGIRRFIDALKDDPPGYASLKDDGGWDRIEVRAEITHTITPKDL